MLLGGGTAGDDRVIGLCSEAVPKSVVGYVSTVITNGRGAELPNPYDYVIHVKDYNCNLPFTFCVDGSKHRQFHHLQLETEHWMDIIRVTN